MYVLYLARFMVWGGVTHYFYLKFILSEWSFENLIAACTSDNAPNITSAIIACKWRYIGCFAHSLNLAVQHYLKKINDIREKIRWVVGHFK